MRSTQRRYKTITTKLTQAKTLFTEFNNYTEEACGIAEQFRDLIAPFIEKYMEEFNSIELQHILTSQLESMIFQLQVTSSFKAKQAQLNEAGNNLLSSLKGLERKKGNEQ